MNFKNENCLLQEMLDNKEFLKMISLLRSIKLESLGPTITITKSLYSLEKNQEFDKIIEILNIIAKYKINVLEQELKEGIRILIKAK